MRNMKTKNYIMVMCLTLMLGFFSGCGNTDAVNTNTALNENNKEEVNEISFGDKTTESEESLPSDLNEPEKPAELDDNTNQLMPRSDAYEMFLNGEMDVTVVTHGPMASIESGTYSYRELLDAADDILYGPKSTEFNVRYSIFSPQMGEEGDDILALMIESPDPGYISWIGLIVYVDGNLAMNYSTEFGYRSGFELYNTGDILSGGSGGAGASYNDYMVVRPDGFVQIVFKSATLYSTWCNEIFYSLDPNIQYTDIPQLTDSSLLKIVKVEKDGKVYICPSNWSEDDDIKTQEEDYVSKMEEMGAIVTDEASITDMMKTGVDEENAMTWTDIEIITLE